MNISPMNAPLDETHEQSNQAIREIRQQVNQARDRLNIPRRSYERR